MKVVFGFGFWKGLILVMHVCVQQCSNSSSLLDIRISCHLNSRGSNLAFLDRIVQHFLRLFYKGKSVTSHRRIFGKLGENRRTIYCLCYLPVICVIQNAQLDYTELIGNLLTAWIAGVRAWVLINEWSRIELEKSGK